MHFTKFYAIFDQFPTSVSNEIINKEATVTGSFPCGAEALPWLNN
jgi:hypothetical protein